MFRILSFRKNLADLAEFTLSPLPPLAAKGVLIVYGVTLVYGSLVLQECSSNYQTLILVRRQYLNIHT